MKNNTISRRYMLRGLGTVIALPLLESLIPARIWAAESKITDSPLNPKRLAFCYTPNGAVMSEWFPLGWSQENRMTGKDFQLGEILSPLQEYKNKILLLSGTAQNKGSPRDAETGQDDGAGDHARANATWLSGTRISKTGPIHAGITIDQVIANSIGYKTRFPSLELACDTHGPVGQCDSGYSCLYSYNLSWKNATQPLTAETNPYLVFEKLFGTDGPPNESDAAKILREKYKKSILDFVKNDADNINKKLGAEDKEKLDQYLTSIREIEIRLQNGENFKGQLPKNLKEFGDVSTKQENFEDLARTMFDLQVLAFQTDQTRIITFSLGRDGENRAYGNLGISEGMHDLSHYRAVQQGQQYAKDRLTTIQTYHTSLLSEFIAKLNNTKETNGKSLLDSCLLVYGSSLSDSNSHLHFDLPMCIIGDGNNSIKTGQHIDLGAATKTPLNNAYVSIAEVMGVQNTDELTAIGNKSRFGDATEKMVEILA